MAVLRLALGLAFCFSPCFCQTTRTSTVLTTTTATAPSNATSTQPLITSTTTARSSNVTSTATTVTSNGTSTSVTTTAATTTRSSTTASSTSSSTTTKSTSNATSTSSTSPSSTTTVTSTTKSSASSSTSTTPPATSSNSTTTVTSTTAASKTTSTEATTTEKTKKTTTPKTTTTTKKGQTTTKKATTTKKPTTTTTVPYDPECTVYGAMFILSVLFIAFMLYMSIFGRRMRHTAVRWHTINYNLWNILQFIMSSVAEKTPWKEYLGEFVVERTDDFYAFVMSIYPTGMIFVYIESMVHLFAPRHRESVFGNSVLWGSILVSTNILMICLFAIRFAYDDEFFYYTPIVFYQIIVTILFYLISVIYLLFCIIGTITHACILSRIRRARGPMFFINMWLLLPYGLLMVCLIAPRFSFTAAMFALNKLMEFLQPIIDSFMSGDGGGGMAGAMEMLNALVQFLILGDPFMLYQPMAQAVITCVCIPMYREQFIFIASCGRKFKDKACSSKPMNKDRIFDPVQKKPGPGSPPPSYPKDLNQKQLQDA